MADISATLLTLVCLCVVGAHICLYSGLLALGVGDTMASIIGSQLGTIPWFGGYTPSLVVLVSEAYRSSDLCTASIHAVLYRAMDFNNNNVIIYQCCYNFSVEPQSKSRLVRCKNHYNICLFCCLTQSPRRQLRGQQPVLYPSLWLYSS